MFVDVSENFGFVQNLLTMLPVHLALYHKKSNPAQKFAKTPLTNQNPARILRFVNSKGAVGNDPTAPFYIFKMNFQERNDRRCVQQTMSQSFSAAWYSMKQ